MEEPGILPALFSSCCEVVGLSKSKFDAELRSYGKLRNWRTSGTFYIHVLVLDCNSGDPQ